MDKETKGIISIISGVVIFIILIVVICMAVLPKYGVWKQGLKGKAEFARAEQNRRIEIEAAKARVAAAGHLGAADEERAVYWAKAEVERAKGVAKANEIIGDSLKGNESYLRYLWIQGLQDGSSEVIYVPTEANLPILEAARKLQK